MEAGLIFLITTMNILYYNFNLPCFCFEHTSANSSAEINESLIDNLINESSLTFPRPDVSTLPDGSRDYRKNSTYDENSSTQIMNDEITNLNQTPIQHWDSEETSTDNKNVGDQTSQNEIKTELSTHQYYITKDPDWYTASATSHSIDERENNDNATTSFFDIESENTENITQISSIENGVNSTSLLQQTLPSVIEEVGAELSITGEIEEYGFDETCTGETREAINYAKTIEMAIENLSVGHVLDEIRTDACAHLAYTNFAYTKCFPCSDDPIQCHGYGTCCSYLSTNDKPVLTSNISKTDIDASTSNDTHDFLEINEADNLQSRAKFGGKVICMKTRDDHHLVIQHCLPDSPNHETRKLCEEAVPALEVTMDTFTLVTDNVTGLTYFNKYCAMCNNVHLVVPWNAILGCQTYVYVMESLNTTQFIRLGMKRSSTCRVEQWPPVEAATCDPRFYEAHREVISTLWDPEGAASIPNLVRECRNRPTDIVQRVIYGRNVFKNIFCLLSDIGSYTEHACLGGSRNPPYIPPSAFSFLFGLHNERRPRQSEVVSHCNEDEWADPKGTCHQVFCSAGKVLNGSQCVTAMDQIKGLPYRLRFWLIPKGNFSSMTSVSQTEQINAIQKEAVIWLQNVTHRLVEMTVGALRYEIDETSVIEGRGQAVQNGASDKQSIRGTIPASRDLPPHLTETMNGQGTVSRSLGTVNGSSTINSDYPKRDVHLFCVEAYVESSQSMSRDEVESILSEMFNTSAHIEDYGVVFSPQLMHGNDSIYMMTDKCNKVDKGACRASQITHLPYYYPESNIPKEDYIEWNQMLDCPYIRIPESKVTLFGLIGPVYSSLLESVSIEFSDSTIHLLQAFQMNQLYKNVGNSESFYHICRDFLDFQIKSQRHENEEDGDLVTALSLYVLSMVVILLSIFCLLATVVTYCLLSELRCVAGCNTLGLSLSMMTAQTITLVVINLEYGTISESVCIFVGISTHYSWLVVVAWSFLCCLHMLLVFTSNVRSGRRVKKTERRRKIRNVLLSLCIPALVVAGVIVTSYLMHDGTKIGYGDGLCLYNSAWSMYIPLMVVNLCNITFFIIVVIKIRRVQQLQANADFRREDRQYLIIYIKLSTVTGVFWFLTMAAEFFDVDVLRYVSTIINGCQGVFIFFSFILNRRVLNLYAQRYGCLKFLERKKSSKSSSNNETRFTSVDASQ